MKNLFWYNFRAADEICMKFSELVMVAISLRWLSMFTLWQVKRDAIINVMTTHYLISSSKIVVIIIVEQKYMMFYKSYKLMLRYVFLPNRQCIVLDIFV